MSHVIIGSFRTLAGRQTPGLFRRSE